MRGDKIKKVLKTVEEFRGAPKEFISWLEKTYEQAKENPNKFVVFDAEGIKLLIEHLKGGKENE